MSCSACETVLSHGSTVCSRKIDPDLSPRKFGNLSKMRIIIGQRRELNETIYVKFLSERLTFWHL